LFTTIRQYSCLRFNRLHRYSQAGTPKTGSVRAFPALTNYHWTAEMIAVHVNEVLKIAEAIDEQYQIRDGNEFQRALKVLMVHLGVIDVNLASESPNPGAFTLGTKKMRL